MNPRTFLPVVLFGAALIAPAADAQTFRETRPIRGAWLRPPGTLAALETSMTQLAQAGITDLYLETFYHGVATNDSDVFNDRFAYDYLESAIVLGAKYNLRVHAWLESAYWQFGTTGAYNFTANPEWRAWNTATENVGGDGTEGQVFANLANPGVQQKMRAYCAELAAYAGLWGVQTDYHRYPLDNNTSDSFTAPWSYDTYSRSAFQAIYGVDPEVAAATPSGSHWSQFLAWRRAGISEAANQMHQGINSVNPGVEFSSAMFATAMTSSAQIAKCQDWPTWAANGYIDVLVPMAYGSTTSSITSDINTTRSSASGKRVVAGLAITAGTRPTITAQLGAISTASVQDFVLFEANVLSDAAKRTEVKTWILDVAQPQKGDFDEDGYVDSRDRALFGAIFTGTPVNANASNRRYDLNGDNVINATDASLFDRYFTRFRFGEDGIVDMRDLAAVRACFGAAGVVPGVQHLYDMDGDGAVDRDDIEMTWTLLLTQTPRTPDADVDNDGRVTAADVYRQFASPADVDGNGAINPDDMAVLLIALRRAERASITSGG